MQAVSRALTARCAAQGDERAPGLLREACVVQSQLAHREEKADRLVAQLLEISAYRMISTKALALAQTLLFPLRTRTP